MIIGMCLRIGYFCFFLAFMEMAVISSGEFISRRGFYGINKHQQREARDVGIYTYKLYQYFNNLKVDYSTADLFCNYTGYQLASIDSNEQYEKLNDLLKEHFKETDRFWTSGNDFNERGQFRWKYNGELIPLDKWWLKGNPSLKYGALEERCVELAGGRNFHPPQSGFVLNDSPCSEKKFMLCEEYYYWDDNLWEMKKLDKAKYRKLRLGSKSFDN